VERVEARLPHPVRVAAKLQQRLHHGARVPELDLAAVATRHKRVRLAWVVLHVARRHHVRLLIHQRTPALASGKRQRQHGVQERERGKKGSHFMARVSMMLMDVPAASATMPGLCGSQQPAVMGADGSSEAGTAPVTLGAPACTAAREEGAAGAERTRARRTSTPQIRKPASSTVAKPRPPCMGQSTLCAGRVRTSAQPAQAAQRSAGGRALQHGAVAVGELNHVL
jgi:hypothetical protein